MKTSGLVTSLGGSLAFLGTLRDAISPQKWSTLRYPLSETYPTTWHQTNNIDKVQVEACIRENNYSFRKYLYPYHLTPAPICQTGCPRTPTHFSTSKIWQRHHHGTITSQSDTLWKVSRISRKTLDLTRICMRQRTSYIFPNLATQRTPLSPFLSSHLTSAELVYAYVLPKQNSRAFISLAIATYMLTSNWQAIPVYTDIDANIFFPEKKCLCF